MNSANVRLSQSAVMRLSSQLNIKKGAQNNVRPNAELLVDRCFTVESSDRWFTAKFRPTLYLEFHINGCRI